MFNSIVFLLCYYCTNNKLIVVIIFCLTHVYILLQLIQHFEKSTNVTTKTNSMLIFLPNIFTIASLQHGENIRPMESGLVKTVTSLYINNYLNY